MTPDERRVIDAARAWHEARTDESDADFTTVLETSDRLHTAVILLDLAPR